MTTRQLMDSTRITEHWITVPLDWSVPDGEQIQVFAREFVGSGALSKGRLHVDALPYLLFLQGGPGGKGTRPAKLGGWMAELVQDFRIVMLDQRGTGRSNRLDRHSLHDRGAPGEQAEYLKQFRADSIVRDAEALRDQLGIRSWTVFGQSFGGFCALTYLSFSPDHLDRVLITGGLAPLTGHPDRVYRQTYRRMAARNAEYFERFPEDRQQLDAVFDHLRNHEVHLLDGSPLTTPRLQMLGIVLGANTKADSLHYLLEEAFAGETLSDTFLAEVGQRISFAGNPMYAVMHESIYGLPGEAPTNWSAERVLAEFPEFTEQAVSPLLTGEMIFRSHVQLDPVLAPLAGTADALAAAEDWGPLYDLDQLARNEVPTAACVYTDDVFVDRTLSLETAGQVANLSVYETQDFHHDGIHDDGTAILRELLRRTE
ncbi:alpha/beta hydrolase [Nesterenkonia salmonea]|uniref:Alpha/beta hydrolase n=1 Tax=Nesterenkonia salmonea TaxID=1804987 RepID=A0A5R9BF56_9MICC|nr:alpha/beta fold hydrolase [Nesterenkonia salmonea]TLP98831.1 alpha/beta hydrolase [Nesterenkonia salmonea]